MASQEQTNLVNQTKGRLGSMALTLSVFCLVGSLIFFLTEGNIVLGIDVGRDKEIWGWTLMLISVFLSTIGLTSAFIMPKT